MSPFEVAGPSSSTGPNSTSKVAAQFIGMGFPKEMDQAKPYSVGRNVSTEPSSSAFESNMYNISDDDSSLTSEESMDDLSGKDMPWTLLVEMGYDAQEVSIAIDKLGPDVEMTELIDHICAARLEKELQNQTTEPPLLDHEITQNENCFPFEKKRRHFERHSEARKREGHSKAIEKKHIVDGGDDQVLHLPNPMIGYGVPDNPWRKLERKLPDSANAPPYFYYENVALAPKGVWGTISRFLYDVEPEFVDSVYFSAAARKRGYVHNLPITNRFSLLPAPPLTIQDAFPLLRKWWPKWDERTKLNCVLTKPASAKLTEKIRTHLEAYGGDEPPLFVKKYILEQCRKWNLVWVGKNRVAPLDPDEIELLLGFPKGHSRGGGTSVSSRYTAVGNSFQVDTVAYHLSVLKRLFPNGMNVLSLFSGIGGAEVALHRLGIGLKNVVSVEICEVNRNIMRSWWEQTNQQGSLVEAADVEQVTGERIEQWIGVFGGFDLVIGGSPCSNLSGSNRVSRNGLEGDQSSLFFHYYRVLNHVKSVMGEQG
ncbi:DNA methylase, C-5 cytosine-specific, active site [Trema orientale]|uniref:DNA (cytosine-5-)-methyltransferase n=1 Tax=Trema orientale TaxID=63057 RepID=A0A2P5FMH7_TREOI|nr:DNA methylase, C-5 cytosine-specific, active site [Trema orientale]